MHWVCLIMQWACQTFLFGWQVNLFWPVYAQRVPLSAFSIKRKCFHHCFSKSNLLIYLAVYIQFVQVYIHTHFKDGYQYHQFLLILNTHHPTSSPIKKIPSLSVFFHHQNTKGQPRWICIIGLWLFYHYLCCKIDLLVNNHCHIIMLLPPHHTLLHNASSSSKHTMMMMMMMTN